VLFTLLIEGQGECDFYHFGRLGFLHFSKFYSALRAGCSTSCIRRTSSYRSTKSTRLLVHPRTSLLDGRRRMAEWRRRTKKEKKESRQRRGDKHRRPAGVYYAGGMVAQVSQGTIPA